MATSATASLDLPAATRATAPRSDDPDPRLRVLIADAHRHGGGQTRYVVGLAAELAARGHEVLVGCRPGSRIEGLCSDAGIPVESRFDLRAGARVGAWANDIRLLAKLLNRTPIDVVHVNGSADHWAAAIALQTTRLPTALVRTRHNTYRVKNSWPNRVLNRSLTTRQIAVCRLVRDDLAQHPAFCADALSAIHNGVDPALFSADPETRARMRNAFGYEPEHVVIGCAARFVAAKGHRFLIDAFARTYARFPEARLLLLGHGGLEGTIREQVERTSIEAAVHFAGFREDIADCTQAFDIAALASVDCDTSSYSLKEAMATAKPVVSSDYGGLTEVVAEGIEGRLVSSGTVEPLAEALSELVGSEALRRRMGQAGRERILREFSIDGWADRTIDVYRAAIADRHARSPS